MSARRYIEKILAQKDVRRARNMVKAIKGTPAEEEVTRLLKRHDTQRNLR